MRFLSNCTWMINVAYANANIPESKRYFNAYGTPSIVPGPTRHELAMVACSEGLAIFEKASERFHGSHQVPVSYV
jgi:hypothetical protein